MNYSGNIILEALRTVRYTDRLSCKARSYRWVSILPSDHSSLQSDLMYVCLLSEYLHFSNKVDIAFVCIRDRFLPPEEEQRLQNAVIVDKWDVGYVYNLIQEHLIRISEWVFSMQRELLRTPSYQTLMELCEDILKNPVYALDESYSLLAYTHNLLSPDPINTSLVEQGHHTDSTIAKLKSLQRFGAYRDALGVYLADSGEVSEFESVCKWIRFEGELCVQLVMVCCNTSVSAGLIELFELFSDYFRYCFIALYRSNSAAYSLKDSLLYDMLYNDLESAQLISERAQVCGLPFRGNFNVFRIVFTDNSTVWVGRVVQKLKQILPDARIISREYEITVLNQFQHRNDKTAIEKLVEQITTQLRCEQIICGVSLSFETLDELPNAARQATDAARIGEKLYQCGNYLQVNATLWEQFLHLRNDHVYFYDELIPYTTMHYYQTNHAQWLRNAPEFLALKRLLDYDRTRNSSLAETLLAWLVLERRATAVGELLHMHRNNVLYSITRISGILNMELDNPMTRYQLLSSFILLGLEEADRHELTNGAPSP